MSSAVVNNRPLEDATETTSTTVGESKPLHRFIKGEPKAVGIVLLILGSSQFILSIPLKLYRLGSSARLLTGFWMGGLFMVCGLLFVLAEIRPSKKLVTVSLALSLVTLLGIGPATFPHIVSVHPGHYYDDIHDGMDHAENLDLFMQINNMVISLEMVFLVHTVVGGVLLVVMCAFSRTALRSSRTRAVVVMTSLPTRMNYPGLC